MAGGRPPKGPKLVRDLGGSAQARKRLEAILATVAGGTTVREACERLGVKETAFYKMRAAALEAARQSLEPKPMGRPPKLSTEADRRVAELEAENDRLKKAVAASQVREELALAMPFLDERRKLQEKLDTLRGEKAGPGKGAAGSAGEPQGGEARRTDEGGGEGEDAGQ
jgi:transposase-like protein